LRGRESLLRGVLGRLGQLSAPPFPRGHGVGAAEQAAEVGGVGKASFAGEGRDRDRRDGRVAQVVHGSSEPLADDPLR
jgi:hypothetical protein